MNQTPTVQPPLDAHYTTVIVGTGFGGTMTGLTLAKAYKERNKGETILMLERGTWWTTPVGTVQDKEVAAEKFLKAKGHPVQFWSSAENFKGLIDIATRCIRRKGNEDGPYDLTNFEKKGFLGIFGNKNDGVSILRASGVGGGSLVYANVTIQPPDFIFDDPRWPSSWKPDSGHYYDMARNAIGLGVLFALDQTNHVTPPHAAINTGLRNIATRTTRLDPHWAPAADGSLIKRLNPGNTADPKNALWLDRARVFQTAMADLTADYGTCDSSINDLVSEPALYSPGGAPKNYCERQGRCIVGCLPGARHTLNKQLMAAVLGNPTNSAAVPDFGDFMRIQALAEVDYIRAVPAGGYEVHFLLRDPDKPAKTTMRVVTAEKVIVAAGCVGTKEIMLRSRKQGGLPNLSDKTGFGFSTNGDLLAFLGGTKERVSLTRGPVTTSYGHFNSEKSRAGADPSKFHTIKDNGIPRALASLAAFGIPTLQGVTLDHGNRSGLSLVLSLLPKIWKHGWQIIRAPFLNDAKRQDVLTSRWTGTGNQFGVLSTL